MLNAFRQAGWFGKTTATDSESDAEDFLNSCRIGVEALWLITKEGNKLQNDLAVKIDKLFGDLDDNHKTIQDKWRALFMCERLMSALLPLDNLIAEGDRRLIEAAALKMQSADDIGRRWNAAKQDNSNGLERLRAIYSTLIDDLHWLYNKRSLDRKLRSSISKQLDFRALLTIFFCALPLCVHVVSKNFGFDLLANLKGSDRVFLVGCAYAIPVGALGAIFSRLASFQSRYSNLDYDSVSSDFVSRSLNLRQLIGAIGATIFFVAIFGGLVGGQLFPNEDELKPEKIADWPNPNFAKLIIWFFIAGFSERLVPDFLSRSEASAASTSDRK